MLIDVIVLQSELRLAAEAQTIMGPGWVRRRRAAYGVHVRNVGSVGMGYSGGPHPLSGARQGRGGQ